MTTTFIPTYTGQRSRRFQEPVTKRDYSHVVDFFHNYEHDPAGLTHCEGSEANPYHITHVRIAGRSGVQHVINLAYARGHGKDNQEQWFHFALPLRGGHWLEKGQKVPIPDKALWDTKIFAGSNRKPNIRLYNFQDRPTGGQAQRQGSGQWEGLVNRQQRRLVKTFDAWAAPVKDGILSRAQAGQEPAAIIPWVDRQMAALETDLIDVTNKGIIGTARTVAGERFDQPAILGISQKQVRDNTALVRANLVPNIRDKIVGAITDGRFRTRAALTGVFNRIRPMPAQYAGGAWVAIFETERGLGTMREGERRAAGLVAEPIRWVLDPRAEHCADSPGFHGCPSLAGEY